MSGSANEQRLPTARVARLKTFGQYVQCPACGRVILDDQHRLTKLSEPAPCCGASGESRIVWPSIDAYHFLEIVARQDLNSPNECPIAIVFLCTLLELLLENSIWRLLQIHTKSGQLAELILESSSARDRRIKLYNKLADRPLGELLESRGMQAFLTDWSRLSGLRNDIVHGRYFSTVANEADLIRRVHDTCLTTFAEVHNDVQRIIEESGR
jgi:hypothetical protein